MVKQSLAEAHATLGVEQGEFQYLWSRVKASRTLMKVTSLDSDSTLEVVKSSYKRLAIRHHP